MFTAPYYIDIIGINGHLVETIEVKHIIEAANYWHNCILDVHVRDSLNNHVSADILSTLDGRLK